MLHHKVITTCLQCNPELYLYISHLSVALAPISLAVLAYVAFIWTSIVHVEYL